MSAWPSCEESSTTWARATYSRAQGQQILDGSFFPAEHTDWYAQALHQHHLATYLAILTGTPVDGRAAAARACAHGVERRLLGRWSG